MVELEKVNHFEERNAVNPHILITAFPLNRKLIGILKVYNIY
jgi:hypothetical protein